MNETELHKANSAVRRQQDENRNRRERTATTAIKSPIAVFQSTTRSEKPDPTEQELRINLRHSRALKRGQLRSRVSWAPQLFRHARYGELPARRRALLGKRKSWQGLLIWGPQGTGKSRTVCAVGRHLVMTAQAVTVSRVRYDDLLKEVRACYHDGSKQTDVEVMRKYRSRDLLIIEDVGVTTPIGGQETDFSLTTLYLLVDWRLEQMKPTFITSNKNLKNITDSFDARIGSRLSTYQVIELTGKDRRKQKKGGEG